MPSRRQEKINSRMVELVSAAVRTLRDPRIGFLTITGAEITPDLRNAKIFFSVYGEEKAREETTLALSAAARHIRREIGPDLPMRVLPFLQFVYDDRIAYADEMSRLIAQARASDTNPGEPPAAPETEADASEAPAPEAPEDIPPPGQ